MSMSPIDTMEVLQRLINGGVVDTEQLVEAAKTALCALDELAKEDQKRLVEDKTCGSASTGNAIMPLKLAAGARSRYAGATETTNTSGKAQKRA